MVTGFFEGTHFTNIPGLYRSWIEKTVWKFEAEGLRICKILISLEKFIPTVKEQNNFCQFETIKVTIGTNNWDVETNTNKFNKIYLALAFGVDQIIIICNDVSTSAQYQAKSQNQVEDNCSI